MNGLNTHRSRKQLKRCDFWLTKYSEVNHILRKTQTELHYNSDDVILVEYLSRKLNYEKRLHTFCMSRYRICLTELYCLSHDI
jgi:hypothetical protein